MLHSLIQEAQSQGVFLYTEKGALKYRSSKGKLSAELAARLKENKTALIDFLNQHQASAVVIPTNTQLRYSPLTFSQNRVFYLEQMKSDDALYHMTSAFRIKGQLDLKQIETSVNQIIARHAILRTGFEMLDDTPTQRCYGKDDVSCQMTIEIKSNQQDSVWLAEQANRPFDLTHPPLVRISTLLDTHRNEAIVLFVFHHLVFDGYSYSCFFSEFNGIFAAMENHDAALLPELAFQYADYSHWQQSQASYLAPSTLDFWAKKMAGVNDLNSFPTDYPRTAELNSDGALLKDRIDKETTARIKTFAQRQGVSLFSLMSTVYAILVSRWTGNPDVVIGTPVTGREVQGTDQLIGFFANTLLLRSDISLDKPFTELLESSKKNLADSFRHQSMPFERIVETTANNRSHLNAPILQLLFVVNQVEKQPLNIKGCEVESIIVDRKKINFEFELHINDHGDNLEMYWLYAEKLFSHSTAQAIKNSFMTLLKGIIDNAERPVSQLPLVTPSGLNQIQAWNQTDKTFSQVHSFMQGFESCVLQHPNAKACFGINASNETISLSYLELNKRANRLAHYLIAQGAQPDNAIGMAYSWSIDAVISIIAILKSGAAYVPFDSSQPEERVTHIIESAQIKLLIAPDELITRLAMTSVHSLDIGSLKSKKCLDSYSENNPDKTKNHFDSSNLAYVIFTSGSTGLPKGVMVEHKNLNNLMASLQDIIKYQADDVVASMTAPSFDIHVAEILLPLMKGASIAVLNWEQTRSPTQIQTSIEKHGISIMQATPAVWQLLVDNGFKAKPDFKMITGGDHLSANLRQSLLSEASGARLFNLYAPSEATVYCSGNETRLTMPKVHIGHPFPNNRFYILDDAFNHQPIGCIGELFIAGANIARGYLANDVLTKQLFTQDPFIDSNHSKMYRTGDLARRLEDGTVELLGRKDFQLKINGIRVEASEIESHLVSLAGIEQAIVTLNKGENEERHLVAYVIADTNEKLDFDSIRNALSRRLPSALLPHYFVELEQFPLTNNLKIDRKALPSPQISQVNNKVELAQTLTEKRVSAIWETLLNLKNIDIKRNFFSLGGHSLLAIKMVSQLSRELKLDISVKSLIDAGTISQLSRHINTLTTGTQNTDRIHKVELGQYDKPKQLSFSQLRLWGIDNLDAKGKHYCVPLKYAINGTLDKEILSNTLNLIRLRHETLRTAYRMGENEPEQTVIALDELSPVLAYQDLQDSNDGHDSLRKFESTLFENPFNLKSGEVFRAGLVRLGQERYQLFIAIHHIAVDGESLPILLHEISEIYQAIKQKRAPNLASMTIQYSDYAHWQRDKYALQSDELLTSESYWEKRLAGIEPNHGLTLDFPRPEKPSYAGANHFCPLSDNCSKQIMTLASSRGITPFTVIYSAFCVLLSRYTGLKDIVIGTPVANRTEAEIEGLIGFFVNSLALRNALAPSTTFNELVMTSQKNLLDDFDHQSLPFEKVLQLSKVVRRLDQHPIFQIMIVLEHESQNTVKLDQIALLPLSPQSVEARFDMTLGIKLTDQKIHLNWNYATDIFKQETIADMAQHFEDLITLVLKQGDENVFELPFIKLNERAQYDAVLHNAPSCDPQTLVSSFKQQCEKTPSQIALTYNEETLSFLELEQKSNQVANALMAKGVCKGNIVAIKLDRSNHMIVCLLAVLKTGAAYLPIDMKTPQKRLDFVLKDSKTCILITEQYSVLSDVPDCHQIILSELNVDGFSIEAPCLSSPITNRDLAYVIYTSGSTGQPKGVLIEHKGVVNYINEQAKYLALTDSDIDDKAGFLYLTSFAFDTSVASIWGALSSGRNLHILSEETRFDLETINQCFCQPDKYAVVYIPPILLAELEPGANKIIPRVIVSGETISQTLVNQYLSRTLLINEYGPTENSVCSTFHHYKDGDAANQIGQCIGGVNAYVLDTFCNLVPYGVSGELYLSGVGLGRGYLNQKALTQNAFIENMKGFDFPLYKTGDLVKRQRDGSLLFEGRVDDQVKIRGFRIELGEIEQQIQSHQDVESVKLMVLTADNGHQQLASYVISDNKEDALFNDLSNQLSLSLPDYMVPKLWAHIDVWPRTTNGKLDKTQLPTPNIIKQSQTLAPCSDIEHRLVDLWKNVLKIEDVGLNDNFFSLGGDSIISMQLVAKASQGGLYFSVKTLFEYPSIASLIPNIKREKVRQIAQDASVGNHALLPIQHEFFHFAPLGNANHFNQSSLLSMESDFTLEILIDCIKALVDRHDALRLLFEREQARYHDLMNYADICSEIYLEKMDRGTLTNLCNQIHQTINIQQGSLFKAVRIYSGSDIKLFIVIHHLVIDAVSWQILIDDFSTLYQQKLAGKNSELTPKTDAYQTWANLLNAQETLTYFDNHERNYWQNLLNTMPISQALINKDGYHTRQSANTCLQLSAIDTNNLLNYANRAYNTETQELILIGIYLGVTHWKNQQDKEGTNALSFTIETHGRDGIHSYLASDSNQNEIDISQTLGWFSSTYPFVVEAPNLTDFEQLICHIKEAFRQVPNNGLGYGILKWLSANPLISNNRADILFNYFGQTDPANHAFDQGEPQWICEDEFVTEDGAFNHMQPHCLALNARISDGKLNLDVNYDTKIFSKITISTLKEAIGSALTRLVNHCSQTKQIKYTPTDFPLASLEQSDIDLWQAKLAPSSFEIRNLYPATGMQEGLLYHSQIQSEAYITQLTLSYDRLDPIMLAQAWAQLITRHDIFRTAFMTTGLGDKYQVVTDKAALDWKYINLSSTEINFDEVLVKLEELTLDDKRGFDLNLPCLMRFTLVKVDEDSFKLIWTNHHALIDGWCLPVLLSELSQIYSALAQTKPLNLKAAPSYANFIKWLQTQDRAAASGYWTSRLEMFESPTKLPFHASNESKLASIDALNEVRPVQQQLTLSRHETASLKALAQETQCTLNTLMQAAWGLLLAKYSDTDKIIFGTTVSGRSPQVHDIDKMVGLCINTLPVTIQIDDKLNLSTWLKGIHSDHVQAESFSYLPLQDIQALAPFSKQGLFESLLVFENYPIDQDSQTFENKNRLNLVALESHEETNYPLTLVIVEQGGIELKLLSNTQYLQGWHLEQILNHVKQLLLEMIKPSTQILGDIEILSKSDVTHQLQTLNPPHCEPFHKNLAHYFEQAVLQNPNKIALVCDDQSMSYQALNDDANRLAHYLIAQGVSRESKVGIYTKRSIDMVVSILAVIKASACYVPLDANYPQARLDYMVETANIKIILCDDGVTEDAVKLNARYITLSQLPSDVCHDNLGISSQDLAQHTEHERPAYVMFTSGSTGRPKGVVIPHHAVIRLVKNTNYVDLDSNKVIAQINNFSFDATTFEIWGALLNGARLVILSNEHVQSPANFSDKIKLHGIDVVLMTTALVNQMVALKPDIFKTLDILLFGGEKVDKQSIDTILEKGKPKHLVHIYGPTENTTFSTYKEIADIAPVYPIGMPISQSSTYILSSQRELLAFGQVGELYVGGKGLSLGYLNQPGLTQDNFVPSPFNPEETLYRTGDLVRYLKNGDIEFEGRRDDQFKLRGYRIERLEILTQLLDFPLVAQASVELIKRADNTLICVALTLLEHAKTQAEKDELIGKLNAHMVTRLPAFMVPSEYHLYEDLPMTQNGKLDRHKIQALLTLEAGSKQVNTASPRDDIEMALYKIWLGILLNKEIGIQDNFFDIGGSSISAIKVIHNIEKHWSVSISVADMLTFPTIEALGGIIRQKKQSGESTTPNELIEFRKSNAGVNVICPHLGGGTAFGYLSLAKVLPDDYGVYGIQAKGVDTDEAFLPNVQAMADYYLTLVNPMVKQAHVFLGCSYGGYVAFEMARIVQAAGHDSIAILLDSDGTNDQSVLDQITPVSLAVFRQKLITYNGMYPNIDDQQIDRYFRVYNHHLTTLKTMSLATTSAKTILVLATGDKSASYMQSLIDYWSDKVAGELIVEKVEGDHSTMLEAPSILRVADIIRAELN